MTRLALPAAAVLLAIAGIVAYRAVVPPAPGEGASAARLAAELRCPDCQGLSVAESRTAAADAIRAEIQRQLAAGRTPAEIREHFVGRYGEWILLAPRDPIAWLVPLAVLAAAAGRRRARSHAPRTTRPAA
ncbi:MAG TPA: cytochrome c-type biogenesis protein CcmH, partial [Candidatus Limnocylindria bacterium]|nr:cytochrome c-type biogenesis protein CcmH [Candidatus Limnocylindria bacterium]